MIEAKALIDLTQLPDRYGKAAELVSRQLWERPAWQENNVTSEILNLFVEEVEEMEEWWARDLAQIILIESDVEGKKTTDFIQRGQTPEEKVEEERILLNFLAEAGDLGYFAASYFEVSGGQLPSYITQILKNVDEYVEWRTRGQYDLAKCTLMKVGRNDGKYHKKFLQETGRYKEASMEAKENWNKQGGDDWFLPRYHHTFNGVDRTAEQALWEDGEWWYEMDGSTDDFLRYYTVYNEIEYADEERSFIEKKWNSVKNVYFKTRVGLRNFLSNFQKR